MSKKFFILLLLTAFFVISFSTFSEAAQILCSESYETILDKTGFNIKDILSIKSIEKINFNLITWHFTLNDNTACPYFPNKLKKYEIRNTLSIIAKLNFSNGLYGNFQLANFKNNEDASLGLRDVSSFSNPPNFKTLFSGESIDQSILQIRLFSDNTVVHFMYKNCVCISVFNKEKSKFQKVDFEIIDNFIKTIKNVIDTSVK